MDIFEKIIGVTLGIVKNNFSAITGLAGVVLGVWLANRQFLRQRKLDFYKTQLRQLYSPLVSVRKEIRILSEFRLAGEKASEEWWHKVCEVGKQIEDHDKSSQYYDSKGKKLTTQIEYENKQLTDKIIPAYKRMVEIFKENYWLAEENTKEFYPTLIKFVETWERFLSQTHEIEVLQQIQVKEGELMPFYGHLEEMLQFLRKKLKE